MADPPSTTEPRERPSSAPPVPRKPSAFDLETEALSDLLTRMRGLRRRVALPVLVAAGILGNIGLIAHAAGYWPVFGARPDETYVVSKLTLVIAFLTPCLPVVLLGLPAYLLLRARERLAWRDDHRRRGVSDSWLVGTTQRFP